MALFRALETAKPERNRLFSDPLATAFLTGRLRAVAALAAMPGCARLLSALIDLRWPGPRASAVVRTRAIDDALTHALAGGLDQLVLLGAGYDTRPYRLPEVRELEVFEVDHPATQAVKRAALRDALGELPEHVRYVAIDFNEQSLKDALTAAGLTRGRRTFTIWEGVVAYLTPAAVDATLRWASDVSGGGSELVFTYVHEGLLDGSEPFPHAGPWVDSVRAAGEPFVFGLHPAKLATYLAERGWRLLDDLSTIDALARYGLAAGRVPGFYRIARARTE